MMKKLLILFFSLVTVLRVVFETFFLLALFLTASYFSYQILIGNNVELDFLGIYLFMTIKSFSFPNPFIVLILIGFFYASYKILQGLYFEFIKYRSK